MATRTHANPLRKYKPFFKAGVMGCFAYRFAILMWIIITAFQVAAVVFLWLAVYKSSANPVINGFTIQEMIVYMVFTNIFSFTTFAGDTLYQVSQDIKNGTIAMQITKPISYQLRYLFDTLGQMFVEVMLFGLPMYIIAYVVFGCLGFITITSVWHVLISIGFFLILILVAAITNEAISFFTAICSFYTTAIFGLNQMQNIIISFLSGTAIPVSFFPGKVFKNIVNTLPFAGMVQNPVLLLMGKSPYEMNGSLIPSTSNFISNSLASFACDGLICVGIAIAWCIILNLGGALLYRKAIKIVTVQGG